MSIIHNSSLHELKTIPENKRISKRLKDKMLSEIYNLNPDHRQKNSLSYSKKISYDNDNQNKTNHRVIQRKNKSLPKYIAQSIVNNSNQNNNSPYIEHLNRGWFDKKSLLKNFLNKVELKSTSKEKSHKYHNRQNKQKQRVNKVNQKYKLKSLEEIIKKKDSVKQIRNQFLYNNKNKQQNNKDNKDNRELSQQISFPNSSTFAYSNPNKLAHKDSKITNLKYAFENRKFTNLTKYKSSFSKDKLSTSNLDQYVNQQQNQYQSQMKKQKQNCNNKQYILQDVDLNQIGISINKIKQDQNLKTYQDLYSKSVRHFDNFLQFNQLSQLQQCYKCLKFIQSQSKTISYKSLIFLGKVLYYLKNYNISISYLQRVFQQVNYDLFCISTLREKQILSLSENYRKLPEIIQFYSQYFIILSECYKITQNYLCSIKILQEWEKNIVKKYLNKFDNIKRQHKNDKNYHTLHQKSRKNTQNVNQNIIKTYQNQITEDEHQIGMKSTHQNQLNNNIQSNPFLNRRPDHFQNYFSTQKSKPKPKDKDNKFIKKQSFTFHTHSKSLVKKQNEKNQNKKFSMKTLSEIDLIQQTQQQYSSFIQLTKLKVFPYKKIFQTGYLFRARIQYQVKNYAASIKDYNLSLICNQNLQASLQLAILYYRVGNKQKSITFLLELLSKYKAKQHEDEDYEQINQIKYHLGAILYKSGRYQKSNEILEQLTKQFVQQSLLSQIYYYRSLAMMKIMTKPININPNIQNTQLQQTQFSKQLDNILMCLQKSIDHHSSEFYVYQAYFMKIYLLVFRMKNYYGAQHQIDMMTSLIQKNKFYKFKKSVSNNIYQNNESRIQLEDSVYNENMRSSQFNYKKITVEGLDGVIRFEDLIYLTEAIICILKMKLKKGLQLLSWLQTKIIKNQQNTISTTIVSLQNPQNSDEVIQNRSQVLKLIYRFQYYSHYKIRNYKKSLNLLQKIKQIEKLQKNNTQQNQFVELTDQINYLFIQALILMQQKKFNDALDKLKQVERISSSRKSIKSVNNIKTYDSKQTINNNKEYRKEQNYLNTIKALCYILLYKYLNVKETKRTSQSLQDRINQKQQNNNNIEILFQAQGLLSQCLICDKQNFQILYLISVIHYQLQRYQSALNYIRQAIQYSDDHMIKHYYLKANLKLLLGRYDQAIKDYTNAITVYKQLKKQKENQSKQDNNIVTNNQHDDIFRANDFNYIGNQHNFEQQSMTKNLNRDYETIDLKKNQQTINLMPENVNYDNQYYEEHQVMYPEVYLNLAIAYLKYSYKNQFESTQHGQWCKYSELRDNIMNLKLTASQNLKLYFQFYRQKIKSAKKNPNQPIYTKSLQCVSTNYLDKISSISKYLKLYLHTQQVEQFLQTSKWFLNEGYKLVDDEDLMIYFYIAKELNNCLLMMQKIIKKHYLLKNDKKRNHSQQLQDYHQQPYFKSKGKKKNTKYNQHVNTIKNINDNKHTLNTIQSSVTNEHLNKTSINIQKLIFDKKILSCLKDSSSNTNQSYQNALILLLQQTQSTQCKNGNIFKFSDLLFFIGLLYYMMEDYQNAEKYFLESYQIKKQNQQLFSFNNIALRTELIDIDEDEEQNHSEKRQVYQQLDLEVLKNYEEIYQNRIYTKEEIQYNIGLACLMQRNYKNAYEYLRLYPEFLTLLEIELKQQINSQERHSNSSSKDYERQSLNFNNKKMNKSIKSNNISQIDNVDITPFPVHNRLCSIYPERQINGKRFSLSFCLPKIQIPHLGIFDVKQLQIAGLVKNQQDVNNSKMNDNMIRSRHSKQFKTISSSKSNYKNQNVVNDDDLNNFLIKKQNIIDFLDIIDLKDIQMKPIAPWIKKDKQKKCIRFTQNFLSQSFDLKTECTTQRRKGSNKELFGGVKNNIQGNMSSNRQNLCDMQSIHEENSNYKNYIEKYENGNNKKVNKIKYPVSKRYQNNNLQ